MKQTDVYVVVDLSESMAGTKELLQRKMVNEMVRTLATEERRGNQSFQVTIIGFADYIVASQPKVASAITSADVEKACCNLHGNTALLDGIGLAFDRIDASYPKAPEAYLVAVFSDGEENRSRMWGKSRIASKLKLLEEKGNITLTFAGPASARHFLRNVGIPEENFKAWDGSEAGLVETASATVLSTQSYVNTRSSGALSTNKFYADPSKLTTGGVRGYTKEVKPTEVRTVTKHMEGRSIADFYGSKFQPGQHYYQLVKPEYIQDDKDLVIHIKDKGEYRQGSRSVRTLLGLPETGKIRLHPGPHSTQYDIYVQSSSVNRKVVAGQLMLTI